MPDITGRLRTPRLAAAPSAPAKGEMYFDTVANVLYWYSGTAWVAAVPGTSAIFPRTYKDMTNSAISGIPERT